MTHERLVLRAGEYLRGRTHRCTVVALERHSRARCIPDALGWNLQGFSVLIECKTSRADFLADQQKKHRQQFCVGRKRYYLTPPELVSKDELPDGWGLLECTELLTLQCIRGSREFDLTRKALEAEKKILLAQVKTEERGHVNIKGEPLLSHPEYEPAD